VYRSCKDMVKLLVKNGADTTFVDANGKTAKELAIADGDEEMAALL